MTVYTNIWYDGYMPSVYHGVFGAGSARPFELSVTIALIVALMYLELVADTSEAVPKSRYMLPFLLIFGTMVGYIVIRPFLSHGI